MSSPIHSERRPLLEDDLCTGKPSPLPKLQITVLCCLRILDPLNFSQILPYINDFVKHLHLTDDPSYIGYYSGLVVNSTPFFVLYFIIMVRKVSFRSANSSLYTR